MRGGTKLQPVEFGVTSRGRQKQPTHRRKPWPNRHDYVTVTSTPCPICGALLQDGHVDHTPPLTLARLLKNWLSAEGLTHADIEIIDAGTKNLFADRTLGTRWVEYHRVNAKLRLIHPGENLAQSKNG